MPEYLAPGVYVEETSFRPKTIEGVSTSTTAFVGPTRKGATRGTPVLVTSYGEFARIYGGLENLYLTYAAGQVSTPNYIAHAVRSFFDNGGARLFISRAFTTDVNGDGVAFSSPLGATAAHFRARGPGAGLNGTVRIFEKRTPAAARTMEAAPIGSLLRYQLGSEEPEPAQLLGGAMPLHLNDDDVLKLTVNGMTHDVKFQGGEVEASGELLVDSQSAPLTALELKAGVIFVVHIDGVEQRIVLNAGDQDVTKSLQDLLECLNVHLTGGYARLETDNRFVIGSDSRGMGGSVEIPGPSEPDGSLENGSEVLGFTTGVASHGGNVPDLQNVTVYDLNSLLPPSVVAKLSDVGSLILETMATGADVTLSADDNSSAYAAFGFGEDPEPGNDGSTPRYFYKTDSGWQDAGGAPMPALGAPNESLHLVTVNVETSDADGNVTQYEELGLDSSHPRYIGHVLAQHPSSRNDALQNPYYLANAASLTVFQLHEALTGGNGEFQLANGGDGAEPTSSAYSAALELLEEIEDISIVAAPGHSAFAEYRAIQNSLISHAERMKYRFAVLDTPPNKTSKEVLEERGRVDSTYGALYYPWITIANPLARPSNESIPREISVPPSGAIAGIYARTDRERGVWKAPANEVVRGALRFEREINHAQQEILNPNGVNCLRFFFGRGYRVWGARTVSSDPEWKYVNVRRYFIYLERSIDRSTQWAVFEPNGERLWANVRGTVDAFLYNEWRNGALLGSTPEEAYFVRCDRSTMTQNDLDNGRLICEIGVAVLYPAEFVIFRIGQKTADARA